MRLPINKAVEAERLYLKDLRRNPNDLEALFGLGCVYALTGDLRRAVELWNRCIEFKPDWAEAHISLAWAYYKLRENSQAFRHVEEAYKLGFKLKSESQLLATFLDFAKKPLKRVIIEKSSMQKITIRKKTAILGLIFTLAFAIYIYSPVLYGFPKGGDAPNALSMIRYLEKWWPHFPRWNTEWGCGYPYLTFYPPLGIVFTFLLSRSLNLSIFTAYKIVMLLIAISSSLFLYLLSLFLLEGEAAALVASLLYLLTPGSLNNLVYWGFFAEHFAYPIFLASILLIELYMRTSRKILLIASILSYFLLLLSHQWVAAVGTLVLFTYLLWRYMTEKKSLIRFFKISLIFFGFGLSLVTFWYIPFITGVGSRVYGVWAPGTHHPLSFDQIIGLPSSGFSRLAPWTIFLAALGGFIALRNRKNRFLLFWSLVFIFYLEANRFPAFYFLYGGAVFPQRFLPWASIFLSLLGGYAVNLFELRLSSRKLLIFSIIFLAFSPLAHIHRVEVLGATNHEVTYELMKELAPIVEGRIAFSCYVSQLHETFNLVSDESQLSNYQLPLAPNSAWISMADAYLFKGFGGIEEAVSIAGWYGLEYLFIDDEAKAAWASDSQQFKEFWRGHGYKLYKVVPSTPLVSIGDRRKILVIGNRYAYENIFWALIHTDFDSEFNAIVWIDKSVDKIDIEELRNFDIVILYGYHYRDRDEMMHVLKEYLNEGGNLLIDTGYSPESESSELGEPFPISMTKRGDFGYNWSFTFRDSEILKDVDFTSFSPPRYGDTPWGVSYSFNQTIKPWAETIVWLYGHPIIVVGEYGGGRVVWCGLNLPYHAKSYRNREEAELLLRLLNWLSPPREKSSTEVEVDRPIPEKMIIPISGETERGASVFIRETYFPKWHAYIEVGGERRKLDLYYSGPGFMLVILPEEVNAPTKLILRYETIRVEYVGYIITLCAIILLIIYSIKLYMLVANEEGSPG